MALEAAGGASVPTCYRSIPERMNGDRSYTVFVLWRAEICSDILKGDKYDIQNINIAANNYLLYKDIAEKWHPDQSMKSLSLGVCVAYLFFVLKTGRPRTHVSPHGVYQETKRAASHTVL